VDDEVLVREPLDDGGQRWLCASEVRKDGVILDSVVLSDAPAVLGAQGPGCPVVLTEAISLSSDLASVALSAPSRTCASIPRSSASSVRSKSWTLTSC
jgi:hypothetical protein